MGSFLRLAQGYKCKETQKKAPKQSSCRGANRFNANRLLLFTRSSQTFSQNPAPISFCSALAVCTRASATGSP
jgi:hypothetical protein